MYVCVCMCVWGGGSWEGECKKEGGVKGESRVGG